MKTLFFAAALAALAFTGVPVTQAQGFDWVQKDIDVYDMRVLRVGTGRMTVQIDGIGRRSFNVPREFRFYIDGKPTRLAALDVGQPLRAYVTRSESGELQLVDAGPVRATPPAQPVSAPVVATPAPLPEAMASLPKTGSVLPLPLGIALFAGAFAMGLRLRRRLSVS